MNKVIFIATLFLFVFFRTGKYEISEAEGVQRGTKIVVHLKGDAYDFAKEDIIRGNND